MFMFDLQFMDNIYAPVTKVYEKIGESGSLRPAENPEKKEASWNTYSDSYSAFHVGLYFHPNIC